MKELDFSETIQLENSNGEIRATTLTKNGEILFDSAKEFWLTFTKSNGKEISTWDSWSFIKALYKDLKKGKKNTDTIKALKEDIETLNLTKKDVKKFLKEAFKLLKTIDDKKTARLH